MAAFDRRSNGWKRYPVVRSFPSLARNPTMTRFFSITSTHSFAYNCCSHRNFLINCSQQEILGQDSTGYWSALLLPSLFMSSERKRDFTRFWNPNNISPRWPRSLCDGRLFQRKMPMHKKLIKMFRFIAYKHLRKLRKSCTNHLDFLMRTICWYFHPLGRNTPWL